MLLTTPNVEKAFNTIKGFFKRNNHNVRDYEIEQLKKLGDHLSATQNSMLGKYGPTENLVAILMYHYTIFAGNPVNASEQLRNDFRNGNDLILMKLHSAIVSKQRENILKDYADATPERQQYLISKLENEYTVEQVKQSIKKTTSDLLTIQANRNDQDELF